MSYDLAQFLTARFAEERQAAEEAVKRTTTSRRMIGGQWVEEAIQPPEWRRSAWSPQRVLTEVEARQQMVATYEAARRNADLPHPEHVQGVYPPAVFVNGFAWALEHALRLLATPYADHPDYRAEWRAGEDPS